VGAGVIAGASPPAALDRYRPDTFEGWLYRITSRNLFLDGLRPRTRARVTALPTADWREPHDVAPDPAKRAASGWCAS
jgi:RNA polymerase sigma-70 factor, ECF subfamily